MNNLAPPKKQPTCAEVLALVLPQHLDLTDPQVAIRSLQLHLDHPGPFGAAVQAAGHPAHMPGLHAGVEAALEGIRVGTGEESHGSDLVLL